jgi:hypothetical protein
VSGHGDGRNPSTRIVALINNLATEMPRNSDIHELRRSESRELIPTPFPAMSEFP